MVLELITLCTLLQLIHQALHTQTVMSRTCELGCYTHTQTHLSWAKRGALKQRQTVSGVGKHAGADTKAHYTQIWTNTETNLKHSQ